MFKGENFGRLSFKLCQLSFFSFKFKLAFFTSRKATFALGLKARPKVILRQLTQQVKSRLKVKEGVE
jgi:hypothetical protein